MVNYRNLIILFSKIELSVIRKESDEFHKIKKRSLLNCKRQ